MSDAPQLAGFQPDDLVLSLPPTVQVYVVGGAVRDALLKRPSSDRDWVVVGATPELMVHKGFVPVGTDFPVFLHPQTHEEYALARTERKSGHGYKGFAFHASPEVSLEDDLSRRDFTINAMAMDQAGRVVDPYGGFQDLNNKVMRHVSPAFAEDPLRVLRLARFLARFEQFTVHPSTLALCQQLCDAGELQHLVPERTVVELSKGFSEPTPTRMLNFLDQLQVWPHMPGTSNWPQLAAALHADFNASQPKPWSCWMLLLGVHLPESALTHMGQALRMPSDLTDSLVVMQRLLACTQAPQWGIDDAMPWLAQVDVYRKPQRLLEVAQLLAQQPAFWPAAVPSAQCSQRLNWAQLACAQVLSGQFKAEQRAFMQKGAGQPPAALAMQFKRAWATALLQAQTP